MGDTYRVNKEDCPTIVDDERRQLYMEIVGSLMYLGYMSRPDIAYACSQLGGVLQNPGEAHLTAAKRVIRYLIGTRELGLLYKYGPWDAPGFGHPIKSTEIVTYTDADWAGDRDSRQSSTCYMTFLSG